jgi:hypothetical protein
MAAARAAMADWNTSRGCTRIVSSKPCDTCSTRIKRRLVFKSNIWNVSTFLTRFCSRKSPATASGLSSTGDSRCNSSAILLPSVNAATRVTALSRPIPRMHCKSSTDARAIAPSEPNLQTNCLPMSSAFVPRKPVLTRMATSSAGLNACAPHSMSRSGGLSPTG